MIPPLAPPVNRLVALSQPQFRRVPTKEAVPSASRYGYKGVTTRPVTRTRGGTAVSADAVCAWVLTIAAALRLSQAKTLAHLVEAACRASRATLSALARCPAP